MHHLDTVSYNQNLQKKLTSQWHQSSACTLIAIADNGISNYHEESDYH